METELPVAQDSGAPHAEREGYFGRRFARVGPVLALAAFIATCVGYFLLCRRLSLVFEWAFLCGFLAALPFSLAATRLFRGKRWTWLWEAAAATAAFTAFFWSAAGVLWLKT